MDENMDNGIELFNFLLENPPEVGFMDHRFLLE